MALKKYKAMTNGLRHMTSLDYAEITTDQPEKSLLRKLNKNAIRFRRPHCFGCTVCALNTTRGQCSQAKRYVDGWMRARL